ncbi:copper resistance CopC family protein [Rhodococcus sp. NM-2]|jgi:methionine-rich copper-binding protein CopC|uniref:copper resistance CopC family protein n=1 Tax=Rhodococcus TaxID=1827 RepID=UPI0024759EAB|nr:copper resistance protein CopC [Rhodococcus opacus]MDH6289324.1 methionine-rich copper-binding protein CopC [Rhodococcus opacus]
MTRRTTFTSVKVIAVGLLTMLASMLGAGTALAHSVVISSTPENGAEIASGPERVSVTFNEALQESFASLTVVGPDGNLWTKGDPAVEGPTVSAELGELGPAGVYTVAFRVTSADGHPVSGTRTFTLTEEGSGTPGAAADSSGESGSGGVPLWPFIVAGVLVFGGGLWFALRKPRGEN